MAIILETELDEFDEHNFVIVQTKEDDEEICLTIGSGFTCYFVQMEPWKAEEIGKALIKASKVKT